MIEYSAKIDPEDFKKTSLRDDDDYFYDSEELLVFVIDTFNEQGIDCELQYQDTDFFFKFDDCRFPIDCGTSNPDYDILEVLKYIVNEMNCEKYESWYTYKNEEIFFHIKEKEERAYRGFE